jgi:hypothetical protein
MRRSLAIVSVVSWVTGIGLLALAAAGITLAAASSTKDTGLTREEALAMAGDWAKDKVPKSLGIQVQVGDEPIALADMDLVDLHLVKSTKKLVASIETGAAFDKERDVWVVSWERVGVANVTTGAADGTAYVVILVDDKLKKVASANIGVRQAEDQARAHGTLPSFQERFGDVGRIISLAHSPDCVFEPVGTTGLQAGVCEGMR